MRHEELFDTSAPYRDSILTLVVSDFGRDAALRFCAHLADAERTMIANLLPEGEAFYDEYRRMSLILVGDLAFAKTPRLSTYRRELRTLDDEVLVGFPGGPSHEDVTDRLGTLVLEAMHGPLRRGYRKIIVVIPCNTLAPASWALAERFGSTSSIGEMIAEVGVKPWTGLDELLREIDSEDVRLSFPTVPEAVIAEALRQRASTIEVWGTEGIEDVYAEAARRAGSNMSCNAPDSEGASKVRYAIKAAISGSLQARTRARARLEALAKKSTTLHGSGTGGMLCVEACTDLDYGVGLDSNQAYVDMVLHTAYNDEVIA